MTIETLTMGEAINRAMREAFDRPEPVLFLGQHIGAYGGTFGVSRGLFDTYGGEIIRDGPLCESATVGFAIGLAVSGVRTIAEIEFFDFAGVAMDQIFNQAAKIHYFTGGNLSVPLVIRAPSAARLGGGPQHSQSLEGWFMHIPGIKVVAPSNAGDALGLMRTALLENNPVLFVEHVQLYGRRSSVDLSAPPVPFGLARVALEGSDVTVVAWSAMVDEALAAADVASKEGISVEVIDLRSLSPLDMDSVLNSLSKTHRLIVTHEAHRNVGPGAEISARCMEEGFDLLDAPVKRVAALDVPIPCGPGLVDVYPDADKILAAVRELTAT